MNLNKKYSDKAVWQIPDKIALINKDILRNVADEIATYFGEDDDLGNWILDKLNNPDSPLFNGPDEG